MSAPQRACRPTGPSMGLKMPKVDIPKVRLPRVDMQKAKAAALGLVFAASLALAFPTDAFAAKSGGRIGGGSFKRTQMSAPRSTGASSYGGAQYGGGGTTIIAPSPRVGVGAGVGVMPMPVYSSYGYGAPMLFGPSFGSLVLVGSMLFMATSLFGGWGQDEEEALSVCKVQVATNCPDRGPNSVLGVIARLADEVDTDDEDSLASMVSDVALALLRKEGDWISAKIESVDVDDEDEAEATFSQMSLKERAKIERETINRVRGNDKSDAREGEGKLEDIGKATSAVITLILCLQGRKIPEANDMASLRKSLSSVGSDVVGNDSLLAAEVMWTPEEPWETMTPDEVILDYPDHIPL